jgi:hypothetical protein
MRFAYERPLAAKAVAESFPPHPLIWTCLNRRADGVCTGTSTRRFVAKLRPACVADPGRARISGSRSVDLLISEPGRGVRRLVDPVRCGQLPEPG